MECLPSSDVLEFNIDILNRLRKKYNLDKPGDMDKAIDILEEWLKKQQHFKKTDFSRLYLERLIIINKGSIEKVKERFDRLCTLKTLLPQYFVGFDVKDIFENLENKMTYAIVPKMTDDNSRIFIINAKRSKQFKTYCLNITRAIIFLCEYGFIHDYTDGVILLIDLRDCDFKEALWNFDAVDIHQSTTLILQAYGLKIKGINFITKPNKFIEILVSVMKKALGQKMGGRVMAHNSMETVYELIPKRLLPKDYGGDEEPLTYLHSKWVAELTADEFLEYFEEIRKAATDESLRPTDRFNDQCMGLPGTFRMLSVD